MTRISDTPDLAKRLRALRRRLLRESTVTGQTIDRTADRWTETVAHMTKHRDAILDDVDQDQQILDQLLGWAERPTWALVLTGDYDTGKTFTAVAIASELVWHGYPATITACRDLVASIKPNGGATLNKYRKADLLVIDGLSEVELSKWDVEQLKAILLDRYEQSAPTIITTNLEAGQLRSQLGGAVWSRFNDDGVVLALNDRGRRTNRQRFRAATVEAGMRDRLTAYRELFWLGDSDEARRRINADPTVRHDPIECGFTLDEADRIKQICQEVQREWNYRIARLVDALTPLGTGPNAPHQAFEWFCDQYEQETTERFRLAILNSRLDPGDLADMERIARECGILADESEAA